ncbi:hypothetical protein WT13_05405 [Burkholderia anthina]|nr:hypothetical protein WT13_05405 [Burkholderia anthina]
MRLPKAFSAPAVSRDQSSLRVTHGFWSRGEVRFNAGDQVVILDSSLTAAQIRKLCLQLYRKHLRDEITARFDRCFELSGGSLSRAFDSSTSNFRLWFPLTLFRTFHQQLPSGKNRDAFTWQEFAVWFKESYRDTNCEISLQLSVKAVQIPQSMFCMNLPLMCGRLSSATTTLLSPSLHSTRLEHVIFY